MTEGVITLSLHLVYTFVDKQISMGDWNGFHASPLESQGLLEGQGGGAGGAQELVRARARARARERERERGGKQEGKGECAATTIFLSSMKGK